LIRITVNGRPPAISVTFSLAVNEIVGRSQRVVYIDGQVTNISINNKIYKGRKMAETVDELTIEYKEGDLVTVKELDKQVLTKGAWATLIYRYQDWDAKKEEYSKDRYTIRRYQKRNGEYNQKSKFNISSTDQAKLIIAALQKWTDE